MVLDKKALAYFVVFFQGPLTRKDSKKRGFNNFTIGGNY
jgi:hypothetical protein